MVKRTKRAKLMFHTCRWAQGVVPKPMFTYGSHVFEAPIMLSSEPTDVRALAVATLLPPLVAAGIQYLVLQPIRRRARYQQVSHTGTWAPCQHWPAWLSSLARLHGCCSWHLRCLQRARLALHSQQSLRWLMIKPRRLIIWRHPMLLRHCC